MYLLCERVLSSTSLLVAHVALSFRVDGLRESLLRRLRQRHRKHYVDLQEGLHQDAVVPTLQDERN